MAEALVSGAYDYIYVVNDTEKPYAFAYAKDKTVLMEIDTLYRVNRVDGNLLVE